MPYDDMKRKARKGALSKFKKLMQGMGGDGYEKGITAKVIAKDPESLKEGLEKAAEVVDYSEEMSDDYEMMDHGMDYESYSKEDLIEMLKEKKYKE